MTQQKQPNQATRIIINEAAAKAALGTEGNIKTLTLHLGDKAIHGEFVNRRKNGPNDLVSHCGDHSMIQSAQNQQ